MPGQCCRNPSCSAANLSGSEEGVPSSLRTCRCAMVAPASNAACVDSFCSLMVIGTAGLSLFCGTDPVIATVIMQGVVIKRLLQPSDSAIHLHVAVDIVPGCCSSSVALLKASIAQRSICPVPSRYPYLRVSGMIRDAASPIATIPATYHANHCS